MGDAAPKAKSTRLIWGRMTDANLSVRVAALVFVVVSIAAMVFSQLAQEDAFSFSLQLEGYDPVFRYIDSGKLVSGEPIAFRLRRYDVENYGEANLFANVSITLADGTVIATDNAAMTLRALVEAVNANYTAYSESQLEQIRELIEKHPIMKTWDVSNLLSNGITKHPADQTAAAGTTAVFTVAAEGQNLTYQWQYRTSETGSWMTTRLTGSVTDTLSVPAVAARNGYQYRCIIMDELGNILYSDPATLYVE